jgi:hypothetical protein
VAVVFQSFDGCSQYSIIIMFCFITRVLEDYIRNVRMGFKGYKNAFFYNALNWLLQKMKKDRFVFLFSRPTDQNLCLFVA